MFGLPVSGDAFHSGTRRPQHRSSDNLERASILFVEAYMADEKTSRGRWVYSRYITRRGRRIYRKGGKVFRFWVRD